MNDADNRERRHRQLQAQLQQQIAQQRQQLEQQQQQIEDLLVQLQEAQRLLQEAEQRQQQEAERQRQEEERQQQQQEAARQRQDEARQQLQQQQQEEDAGDELTLEQKIAYCLDLPVAETIEERPNRTETGFVKIKNSKRGSNQADESTRLYILLMAHVLGYSNRKLSWAQRERILKAALQNLPKQTLST
jgi:DNA repair exonuclease SbcCD ATPase subunit